VKGDGWIPSRNVSTTQYQERKERAVIMNKLFCRVNLLIAVVLVLSLPNVTSKAAAGPSAGIFNQTRLKSDLNAVLPAAKVARNAVTLSTASNRLAAGGWHTCALTQPGGVKCWGDNAYGQLGDGTTMDRLKPIYVAGLESGVSVVTAGLTHTCALTLSGGVKCWGGNAYGQLGDGSTHDSLTPVDVMGLSSGVVAITAGWYHTCALTQAGGVKCWGDNDSGQLGDAGYDQWWLKSRSIPVDVKYLNSVVTAITAGKSHTCVLTEAGGMMCWGSNRYGQLGNWQYAYSDATDFPVDVLGLYSGLSSIATGKLHTCAVTQSGMVKCWGGNSYGQLGDATTYDEWFPVDADGLYSGINSITAGSSHTCVLTDGGGVKCWGDGYDGQLGDGANTNHSTPVDVTGLTAGASAVAVGGSHTCALFPAGNIKCWGGNWHGQLGDGTMDNRSKPVDVAGFPVTQLFIYLPAVQR
jgi:alpha-tubulin suppressor-like RCC1 family protein